MKNFKMIGKLKVQNGEYEKDGVTKKRWHEIGVVFATPHHSSLFVRFHATANGQGQVASLFYEDGMSPKEEQK